MPDTEPKQEDISSAVTRDGNQQINIQDSDIESMATMAAEKNSIQQEKIVKNHSLNIPSITMEVEESTRDEANDPEVDVTPSSIINKSEEVYQEDGKVNDFSNIDSPAFEDLSEKPKRPNILPVQTIDAILFDTPAPENAEVMATFQETKSNTSIDSVEKFLINSACGPIEPPKTPAVDLARKLPAIRPSSLEISSPTPAENLTTLQDEEPLVVVSSAVEEPDHKVQSSSVNDGSENACAPEQSVPASTLTEIPLTELGIVAPEWVKDADAPICRQCEARFTFTKRRHHCRACGNVFCSGTVLT